MTIFPGSPRLTKGAIVAVTLPETTARTIVFQYNPKSLSRSLEATTIGADGSRTEVLRLACAPAETISIGELEIDATDQLCTGDATAETMGIHPQLAALELLLYPSSASVVLNTALLAAGTIEVIPPEAPFTLFVWGPRRVLPVRITSFTVDEQDFDASLNPIRASLSLSMRVLSYNDFPALHPGHSTFLAHQVQKEAMASLATAAGTAAASLSLDL